MATRTFCDLCDPQVESPGDFSHKGSIDLDGTERVTFQVSVQLTPNRDICSRCAGRALYLAFRPAEDLPTPEPASAAEPPAQPAHKAPIQAEPSRAGRKPEPNPLCAGCHTRKPRAEFDSFPSGSLKPKCRDCYAPQEPEPAAPPAVEPPATDKPAPLERARIAAQELISKGVGVTAPMVNDLAANFGITAQQMETLIQAAEARADGHEYRRTPLGLPLAPGRAQVLA